jgi:hypothetical protein
MKISYKFLISIVLILIPFSAYFDSVYIEKTDFRGYLIICFIEAVIFSCGVLTGRNMERMEDKK